MVVPRTAVEAVGPWEYRSTNRAFGVALIQVYCMGAVFNLSELNDTKNEVLPWKMAVVLDIFITAFYIYV